MEAPRVGCYACEQETGLGALPPREAVASDRHWRVAHALGTALPGWLVLLPRRHVTGVDELTDAEAAALGPWQAALSRALREVTGCPKTYVAQFGEQGGFAHLHFHVIPRGADLPAARRGPGIFDLLRRPAAERVPDAEADRIARAVGRALRHRPAGDG
ncbi:HIT family protein [Streptomyces johnsoniae]|uniref:HIT family protein n=1 Tax=Streptomyces johnsoniae TaxID=3075532 RepID=A0ABU2SDG2_9ACTN|nr:HIT family protein [Streptomyces sp. DSM 41886]MDT0447011.1 HIT family protein [Streptomyces sp. DSM 41886]